MKILPKHLLIESLAVWVLAFYLAMAMTVLVGVIIWLLGEQEVVLKASWVRWCAIIALVPVALRLVRRPETRLIFDRYKTGGAGWQKHRRVRLSYYKEPLQHPQRKQRRVSSLFRGISCEGFHRSRSLRVCNNCGFIGERVQSEEQDNCHPG